jgi:hypothetical protein
MTRTYGSISRKNVRVWSSKNGLGNPNSVSGPCRSMIIRRIAPKA